MHRLNSRMIILVSRNNLSIDTTKCFGENWDMRKRPWSPILNRPHELLNDFIYMVWVADEYHKFHSAPVPYPSIHLSEQKCLHFCSKWCFVRYGTGALCDLRHGSITIPRWATIKKYLINATVFHDFKFIADFAHPCYWKKRIFVVTGCKNTLFI